MGTETISARLLVDPPGCVEAPARPDPFLVLHVGPSGHIGCDRGANPTAASAFTALGWAGKAEMEAGFPGGPLCAESLGLAMAASLLGRHSSVMSVGTQSPTG